MGYGEKAESGAEMRLAVERGRRGAGLVSAEQFHQFHAPVLRCPHSLETAETGDTICTGLDHDPSQ